MRLVLRSRLDEGFGLVRFLRFFDTGTVAILAEVRIQREISIAAGRFGRRCQTFRTDHATRGGRLGAVNGLAARFFGMERALEPPTIGSPNETGMILDVAAVEIRDPAGDGDLLIRLTNATEYLVPPDLRDWAMLFIENEQHLLASGHASMLPCKIEFGILRGRAYAEVM